MAAKLFGGEAAVIDAKFVHRPSYAVDDYCACDEFNYFRIGIPEWVHCRVDGCTE